MPCTCRRSQDHDDDACRSHGSSHDTSSTGAAQEQHRSSTRAAQHEPDHVPPINHTCHQAPTRAMPCREPRGPHAPPTGIVPRAGPHVPPTGVVPHPVQQCNSAAVLAAPGTGTGRTCPASQTAPQRSLGSPTPAAAPAAPYPRPPPPRPPPAAIRLPPRPPPPQDPARPRRRRLAGRPGPSCARRRSRRRGPGWGGRRRQGRRLGCGLRRRRRAAGWWRGGGPRCSRRRPRRCGRRRGTREGGHDVSRGTRGGSRRELAQWPLPPRHHSACIAGHARHAPP